ncbi:hypothetical protein HY624_02335 [Candidatus Uhrbacteria bacterium]|nr:hypothetical protein [Candidatus Uhrbacteria bacterium]
MNFDHRQFLPTVDFQNNVAESRKEFERDAIGTMHRLKEEIARDNAALNEFAPKTLDTATIKKYINLIAPKSRQWYEIMIADGALALIYPMTLPKTFELQGKTYSAESLLPEVALPKKLFPMIEEHWHLLEMAAKLRNKKSIDDDLARHVAQYSWMNSLCWWDEPFDAEYYRNAVAIAAKRDPAQELQQEHEARRVRYAHAEVVLADLKEKYPKAWECIDIIRELTDAKEDNWDAASLAGVRMRPLFKDIARAHGLSYHQFLQLSPTEMIAFFERGSLPVAIDILNERIKHHLVINHQEYGQMILAGADVQPCEQYVVKTPPALTELKGTPVWKGHVTGMVRCIIAPSDVGAMQDGEILVCPMSDPDYMPAIRKAVAIVADQGGLLCHAAIVARELQIPCIVGTEYATKIFKDGDLVEVDAKNGIVKKI